MSRLYIFTHKSLLDLYCLHHGWIGVIDNIENKDPVAPWGCVFERNTADSEKQIDL